MPKCESAFDSSCMMIVSQISGGNEGMTSLEVDERHCCKKLDKELQQRGF